MSSFCLQKTTRDSCYRGEITRERSSKRKLLRDASTAITGVAFKATGANVFLFVATDNSVFVYNITHKDKEQKVTDKQTNKRAKQKQNFVSVQSRQHWLPLEMQHCSRINAGSALYDRQR